MFKRNRRIDSTVGVDFGSRFIKVLQAEARGEEVEIVAVGKTETPEGAIQNGMISQPEAVGRALRDLCHRRGVTATQAVTAVSGPQLVVRKIELPPVSPGQVKQLIYPEAQKHLPYELDKGLIQHQVLGTVAREGTSHLEVMLVAAHRDLVQSRLQALGLAGLEPLVVDIEPYASVYALIENGPDARGREQVIVLVEMGAGHTEVTLVNHGQFDLTRSIPIGGNTLTRALMGGLNLGFAEAEEQKERFFVAPRWRESQELSPAARQVSSLLTPTLESLATEITRTINAYQARFPEGHEEMVIETVLLSGGSAQIPGLCDYLSGRIGAETRCAGVFAGLGGAADSLPEEVREDAPTYAISLGLALRQRTLQRVGER